MKKIVLAIAVFSTIISCKKDGEPTSGASVSSSDLSAEDNNASYAYGISLGQNTERMNGSPQMAGDSLVYDDVQKGINEFLANPEKMRSYAYGLTVGEQIQGALENDVLKGHLSKDQVIAGMMDYLNKKDLKVPADSVNVVMQNFYQNLMVKAAESNKKLGTEYMAKIKNEAGIVSTASGLALKTLQAGTGAKPAIGDIVKVKYTGKTVDGEVFDGTDKNNNGEPVEFPLQPGGLVPGWIEGIPMMNKGGKYTLYLPSDLGYGDQGNGAIKPGQTLIFDIELVDFRKNDQPQGLNPANPGVQIRPEAQPAR